jgi:molybdenum cofactor cytidylyltransferase
MKPPEIAIVVLAAGGSTRMGRPKQLLQFKAKSLVRRAAETAIEAGGDPVVVVTGNAAEQVVAELRNLKVHVALNPSWDRGMGSSIRVGVETALKLRSTADALIITLCDQPGISSRILRELVQAHIETGKPLCAAAFGETVSPPVLFGREFFDELLSLPDEAGAKQILLKHSSQLCHVNCPEAACDVDTPSDYEALHGDSDR